MANTFLAPKIGLPWFEDQGKHICLLGSRLLSLLQRFCTAINKILRSFFKA
jgi:hypothetical protein